MLSNNIYDEGFKQKFNMNIGLILSSVPGYSETFFRNYVISLSNRGYTITLFVNENPNDLKYYFTSKIVSRNATLKFSWFKFFIYVPRFLRYFMNNLKSNNIRYALKRTLLDFHILTANSLDYIHFGFGTLGIGRENLAISMGVKSAVSFRGFDIAIFPLKYSECYKEFLTKVDKIHVISDDINELVRNEAKNTYLPPISKIYPAIDSEVFDFKTNRNWSELSFISVGRLHWVKGYKYILEALSELSKKGFDFRYTIIGSGVEYERLVFLSISYKIDDKIEFLGDLDKTDIKHYLSKNNYFIQYSLSEGFSNAVLEAQSSGLIPIVSDSGGLPENVVQNESGFVVPTLRPDLLKEKLEEIIEMPQDKLDRMSKYASLRVKEEFNLNKQMDEFEQFYKI